MNELDLVDRIRRMSGGARPREGLLLGIGDDCAIYRPKSTEDMLFKTDQLIEGVHFLPTLPPAAIGQRALARALSDIAAMGGTPRLCLVSLTIPRNRPASWILAFFRGLLALARRTGTILAGGDLARSDKLYCDVMLCGVVPRGLALRRDTARPGDNLWISGRLGKPWDRPIRPRLDLGRKLLRRDIACTACIDISDGLALDLHRLCLASGVAAELDRVALLKRVARGASLERALHGGDDYELLFTLPPRKAGPAGTTKIGKMVAGKPGAMRLEGRPLAPRGYDHFGIDIT
jgi:thiamine-monophosphate kinase